MLFLCALRSQRAYIPAGVGVQLAKGFSSRAKKTKEVAARVYEVRSISGGPFTGGRSTSKQTYIPQKKLLLSKSGSQDYSVEKIGADASKRWKELYRERKRETEEHFRGGSTRWKFERTVLLSGSKVDQIFEHSERMRSLKRKQEKIDKELESVKEEIKKVGLRILG